MINQPENYLHSEKNKKKRDEQWVKKLEKEYFEKFDKECDVMIYDKPFEDYRELYFSNRKFVERELGIIKMKIYKTFLRIMNKTRNMARKHKKTKKQKRSTRLKAKK
jgi:hypothetical protein